MNYLHFVKVLSALSVLIATVICGPTFAAEPDAVQSFCDELSAKVVRAEKEQQSALPGKDGWMFFVPELRALSVGPFWGKDAIQVSRSAKPAYADPLPAIVDFNNQLRKSGIHLLVVPVPAKAAVYPEQISSYHNRKPVLLDETQRRFYRVLADQGVAVLDLLPTFLEHRNDSNGLLYCKTDTHWSGRGAALAAEQIATCFETQPWLRESKRTKYASQVRNGEITGDLARMLDETNPVKETLPLTFIGTGSDLTPVQTDRQSPVLLIGDSHTLVFHDPTLHARGAGLPDLLAKQFGFPVDLIGVRGSGATTTRIELLRRRDNLKGKKLVIWCFSFREFTESYSGWRKVPVIR
ncbi:alginate O-acetyltransferase AlgX-related protein [Gimesia panareensis]|uniref:alginate O-acetyltransferase AlgX-related protein n=1 Tax=Gimesia panareensis TaxID=2527978 RepID=UPI0011887D90|nr:hypothetical protein [Gimesia panareensis]QDU47893.1 hypothetical protein Pan110_02030 [Gimesia panareensis]